MIYRLYQLFIALPVGLVLTALTAIVTFVGSIFNAHFWGYWPAHLWARAVCKLLLLPVCVEGRENINASQSYVFVANHQGALDIFLVYGYLNRNFKWMMKHELRRIPLVGAACQRAGHIFVDNRNAAAVRHTYEQARQTLQGGTSVFVFPEGARTLTGRMTAFHKAAFQLAAELQLPVVPMTIDGPYVALPRQRGFWFVRRTTLRLTIHAPLQPPASTATADVRATTDAARATIARGLPCEVEA